MKDQRIFGTDYSKVSEFKRCDYLYTKYRETENLLVWEVRSAKGEWKPEWNKYELWLKQRCTNPDGGIYVRKAGDESFGHTAWFFNRYEDMVRSYIEKLAGKKNSEVLLEEPRSILN